MNKTLTPTELADILESGKYRKATGQLTKEHGLCCLGVYAEECGLLKRHSGNGPYAWVEWEDSFGYTKSSDTALEVLAPAWMKAELDFAVDPVDGNTIEQRLIGLNDAHPDDDWEHVIEFLRTL